MAKKYYGAIGFSEGTQLVSPGEAQEVIVERKYFGDIERNVRQLREGEQLPRDRSVNHSIAIVADVYANQNFHAILYAEWAGACWEVDDVEVRSPRLVLRLGGVYSGDRPETP